MPLHVMVPIPHGGGTLSSTQRICIPSVHFLKVITVFNYQVCTKSFPAGRVKVRKHC